MIADLFGLPARRGLPHSADPEEIDDLEKYIKSRLDANPVAEGGKV